MYTLPEEREDQGMKSKDVVVLPTKNDLMRALDMVRESVSDEQRKLIEANERADAAMEKFKQTNTTYLKLKKAVDEAESARYQHYHREKDERSNRSMKIRRMLFTRGPTPAVIAAVEKLCEDFGV